MANPYRDLAAPEKELATAAALPPDTYHPRGRWAIAGRQAGVVIATLGLAELAVVVLGSGVSALGIIVVGYFAVLVQIVRRRRMAIRLVRENDEAVSMLMGPDLDEAARRLDALAVQARGLGFYHAQVVFNRGVAFLRQGAPEKALALFAAVERSGWFERYKGLGFDALLAGSQALAFGLIDDLPAAERQLAVALDRVSPTMRAKVLLAETVVGLRRGEDQSVAARIDAEWTRAEAVLPAAHLRLLRALQAWAMARAGADDAAVERVLERARPTRHGEHDHVAVRWAELKSFLAERVDRAS